MAKLVCKRCSNKYDNMGEARLPYCRKCLYELPDGIRRKILHSAAGTAARSDGVRQACRLWGIPEPQGN